MAAPEPLEHPEKDRLAALPVRDSWAFEFLEKSQALFWLPNHINHNLSRDLDDWKRLGLPERHFIKHVLAFFAISDAVVNETITEHLAARIQPLELRMVYNYQRAMEDVHNIVYSKLVETYTEGEERAQLLNAVAHFPVVARKIQWCRQHLNTTEPVPLARALFVNCIMEGLFFSGSFCAIFWVGHHHKKLPGLTKANEYISRDEGLHTEFGIYLYTKRITQQLSPAEAHRIMGEALDIERAFIAAALPDNLVGMNAVHMQEYIAFVADQLLRRLGYPPLVGARNPFKFMEKQSIGVRLVDFFQDTEVTEYGDHAAGLRQEDTLLDFASAL